MKVSYSRVNTFKQCPYQYYLRYIKGLQTKFNLDPKNALVLGTAVHTGIEKRDVLEAIKSYYSNYPSVTPLMINEAIKLEILVDKAIRELPEGEYELLIEDDDFKGFIDMLVKVDEKQKIWVNSGNVNPITGEVMGYYKEVSQPFETYDLYDFKYSNNIDNYLKSGQLHVYKYWFEKLTGHKIRNMYFVFIPKVNLKQEEDEDVELYRERLIADCEKQEIRIEQVNYDYNKVIEFLLDTKKCIECKDFNKNPSKLCYWCDYRKYCNSDGKEDGNIIYPEETKKEEK
jgi:hypothetical protein